MCLNIILKELLMIYQSKKDLFKSMAVFTNLYNKKRDLNEANVDDVTLSENYTIARSCWQLKMFAFCVDQVLR